MWKDPGYSKRAHLKGFRRPITISIKIELYTTSEVIPPQNGI